MEEGAPKEGASPSPRRPPNVAQKLFRSPRRTPAPPATQEEIRAQLLELFGRFDLDKNNRLDESELRSGLHKLGLNFSDTKIHEIFTFADADHSGALDVGEFTGFFNYLPDLLRASSAPAANLSPLAAGAPRPAGGPVPLDVEKNPDASDTIYNASGASAADLQELFNLIDVDHSSTISWDELKVGLKKMYTENGIPIDEELLHRLFQLADTDRDGHINMSEFTNFFFQLPHICGRLKDIIDRSTVEDLGPRAQLRGMFESFEKNEFGLVTIEALQNGFTTKGVSIPPKMSDIFFQAADIDQDGFISFEEFVTFFFQLPRLLKMTRFQPPPL